MPHHPSFLQLRLATHPKRWRDRAVIWLGAVITGLSIAGYVWLTDTAIAAFKVFYAASPWGPLLLTPLGGMLVVWLTRRFATGAAGSGIPQVMAAIGPQAMQQRHLFVSLPLAGFKALLGSVALAAGFSAGREGPSVQIAAGILSSFHRLLTRKIAIRQSDLILAGGAAGIAAAFNTPLAGVVFAIEELGKSFEERSSGLLITAIVLAGLVAVALLGNLTYFGRIQIEGESLTIFGNALLVSVIAGVAGGLFSRLLVNSFTQGDWKINRWRARRPVLFAGACGLLVAVLGLCSSGDAFGSGYAWTSDLLSGQTDVSPAYFAVKSAATWLSFWSGIPGGIFAPTLAIGAGLGHDVALLTGGASSALIALSMAGFLAAVTQAPITSFIIVMEMTDGHAAILSLMATALLASMIARLISAPLYRSLATLQLQRLG